MSEAVMLKTTEDRQSGIQVIARAAAIMRVLSGHPNGLSLGAIAQQVDLPRSTVQRIVAALEVEGLAESVGPGGGFRLGPELGRLIYQSQIDIITVVRPLLEELSTRLSESVVLAGAEHDQVLIIDRVVAERELRVVFQVGTIRVPMHTSATGKALLSQMTDEQVNSLLPDPLPCGIGKVRKRADLLAELQEIRATGIASDLEGYMAGIAGYAVPVDTYLGHFAVAVVMPSSRAPACIDQIRDALLACRQNIEAVIGHRVRV
ncbi:MAG: IclR family transcriptional regulator [Spongiibacteraceae bacterium]|jgi:DNA-binding IclR family transcriptional regulator|nr:IclR family transcriptional regulator [Spongiibacteraceae bacterium]